MRMPVQVTPSFHCMTGFSYRNDFQFELITFCQSQKTVLQSPNLLNVWESLADYTCCKMLGVQELTIRISGSK